MRHAGTTQTLVRETLNNAYSYHQGLQGMSLFFTHAILALQPFNAIHVTKPMLTKDERTHQHHTIIITCSAHSFSTHHLVRLSQVVSNLPYALPT